jgi:hypothetical protein
MIISIGESGISLYRIILYIVTYLYCGLINASGPEGIRIQISTSPRHYGAIFFASRRFALLTVRFAHRDASLRAAAAPQ